MKKIMLFCLFLSTFLFLMIFDENTINEVWYILVVNTHTHADAQLYDKLWFIGCQLKNKNYSKCELWCLWCLNIMKNILIGLWPILTWCHITFHTNYISDLYAHALSRDRFAHVPSQWETTLYCNVVSHWLAHIQNNPCLSEKFHHYIGVIMSTMASQITSLTIVYSTVYSGANQRKHQSFTSLAFVWGIHWWLVNSMHTEPVTRKMVLFDDIIMMRLWICWVSCGQICGLIYVVN